MIRLLHGCLLGGFVAVGTSASAVTFVIDDFITVQSLEVTAAGASSAGSSVNTASAVGVERDLFIEKTAGSDGERARVRINPNNQDLLRMTIDDANARVTVTWDGIDGLPARNDVDYDGLGGIDLSAFDTFNLLLTFSDIGGPVSFTFWDANDVTGNTFASATLALPGGVPAGSNLVISSALSLFTATGAALGDILDSVGAMQFTIDATAVAQEGWDMRIDQIYLTGPAPIPLPASALLLGAAVAGFGAMRRRAG